MGYTTKPSSKIEKLNLCSFRAVPKEPTFKFGDSDCLELRFQKGVKGCDFLVMIWYINRYKNWSCFFGGRDVLLFSQKCNCNILTELKIFASPK